ncbi:carboxypeptidase regulatory-like domain-containing protein [candidate division TA06 bacterium]|uniref:Carboxypeptidase regulatory-like domain-containing protein n=1 Tax=candidate division TA06 bacterium TaxID=2250710 RepID=A0A933IBW6_UNCT6|nr:carboxypeptidase regulatory-like domain-containing protein [candidate division TA06 bacterium]
MKKVLLLIPVLLLLLASGNLWAQQIDLIPVKIFISSHDDVYKFQALGVGIEELRKGYIEARVTKAKYAELQVLGWMVEKIEPVIVDEKIVSAYHNYDWLTAKLDSAHNNYPNITKLISIGASVQGRELWALMVSDNPDSAENEAELRFAATIHGNEPVGTELCIAMIDSLTQCYDSIPAIKDLVDNREIWFLPMFNPDGHAANSRYNANGMDLNRNYPVPDGSIGDDGTYAVELENQNMMNWVNSRHFVLGCMYHEGAVVVNYQWDYSGAPTPDDRLIREVSLGYARLNSLLYNENYDYDNDGQADSGVVFGYYWYPVSGSLQDWSYFANSCIDLTIEIDTLKTPPASHLPQRWADNRSSMLYLIRQSGLGIQGIVTDSASGQPLDFVQVEVVGINKSVYTDTIGDYHRMLLSGTYDFTFSKEGYFPKTISGVRVNYDSLTILDVALAKDPGEVTGGKPSEIVWQKGQLLNNRPNPFSNQTAINYQIAKSGIVSLKVYNAAGQLVRILDEGYRISGEHSVNWDGRDKSGKNVSNGVYIYRLQAGDISQTRKMVVLR